jgi:hypothetical protein
VGRGFIPGGGRDVPGSRSLKNNAGSLASLMPLQNRAIRGCSQQGLTANLRAADRPTVGPKELCYAGRRLLRLEPIEVVTSGALKTEVVSKTATAKTQ